ncbi:MAG: sigma-54-dependent Fis family transcriptional regulator [Aliivibrio sp.]|uniref:sigma-54-dependent transcriptional regulator n=1 Tax=Aliivibrio sp. TaxID=1872443 RepID=UPI001A4A0F3B|nr:sigma-54-dependent Fis family transcriptional regulator [Aliivibrio sp.]
MSLSSVSTTPIWSAFSVLVVDDEIGMQTILKKALSKKFAQVITASDIKEAERLRKMTHFDLMILDINLPGRSGIDWHEAFSTQGRGCDVIFMTGYADLDMAIKALRIGAADFILKPFNLEQMMNSVQRCIERRQLERNNFALQRESDINNPINIIGHSSKTEAMKSVMSKIAPSSAAVLIQGESGTGKELVARGIHQMSNRTGPFVPINCGAIASDLLESELFGHVSGAFTGAKKSREGLFRVANNGTLFLDEIGEMPLTMQASLLRAIEQKAIRPVGAEKEVSVDVRIVAATNRDLQQEVASGRFREDLYYRLNVLIVELPPLRERKEDLVCLIEHFTTKLAKELSIEPVLWTHEDVESMGMYDWPGNIRELKNLIERCLLLGKPPVDYWRDLQPDEQKNAEAPVQTVTISVETQSDHSQHMLEYPEEWLLKEVEKAHIIKVVSAHDGNKSAAARQLGVARKTLERKFKEWHVCELIENES